MNPSPFQSCIEACNACSTACDHCAAACLQEPDVSAMVRCIALDMDCAQICRMAASYMARNSELSNAVCQLCADICYTCGDECAKYPQQHCQDCASACRSCAQECLRMSGSGQGIWRESSEDMPAH